MKFCIYLFFIFHIGIIYSQSFSGCYNQFTPERRQILSKMGIFFDETIRKNFPSETDNMSYLHFLKCFAQTGGIGHLITLDVDRDRLKEINQMLFKDHIYYFFYVRYIYMGRIIPLDYREPIEEDTVPTKRVFLARSDDRYGIYPILNKDGYIKIVPDDIPAIKLVKEEMSLTGDLSITIFMNNVMGINVREVTKPIVKELCAVVFWRYICNCGGVDLVERKQYCESCDLL